MRVGHPLLRDMELDFWGEIDAQEPGIDRSEFRRRVLGLVFLRYLDESFADRRAFLLRESREPTSVYFCLEEERNQLVTRPDVFQAVGVAYIVPAARWERLARAAAAPEPGNLGRAVDAILISVVQQNPHLEGIFPDDYSRPELSRQALGRAILAVSRIAVPVATPVPVPSFQYPPAPDEIRTTADALALICQGFLAEATVATDPGPNRLRVRTPVPISTIEYAPAIARLDRQLQELARILGRRPRVPGSRTGDEG